MLPGDGSLLIEPRSLRLDVILDLAKRWDEPAERSIVHLREAVAAALDVYRVTPKRIDVIFNPKIKLLDRDAQLGTLARWWSVSRLQLDIPEPDADLPTVKPRRDYLSAMGVLNLLVRAALQGRDAASLRAFNSRRLPFSVFRNVDGSIGSLVEAVGKLDAAQVSEMHWLLQLDLAKGG